MKERVVTDKKGNLIATKNRGKMSNTPLIRLTERG